MGHQEFLRPPWVLWLFREPWHNPSQSHMRMSLANPTATGVIQDNRGNVIAWLPRIGSGVCYSQDPLNIVHKAICSPMGVRTVPVVEAQARFSALLAEVEAGTEVRITRRGRTVTRIVPEPAFSAASLFEPFWADPPPDLALPENFAEKTCATCVACMWCAWNAPGDWTVRGCGYR